MMAPDDPRHGTYAGWQAHYSKKTLPACESCVEARRTYQMRRDKETQLGRVRKMSAEPVRKHLRRLVDAGMSYKDVAAASGIGRQTIEHIGSGQYDAVLTRIAAALLAVKPQAGNGTVPLIGYARRLQALQTLGWSSEDIAAEAARQGHTLSAHTLKNVRTGFRDQDRVSTQIALGIAAAYDALGMTIAPDIRRHNVIRALARSRGYAPPMAWLDIDDPNEIPAGAYSERRASDEVDEAVIARVLNGERMDTTRAEREEIIARWGVTGRSLADLERMTGWKLERYRRAA